ncbi:DUF3857 and transglutaminase domain-containing protein [Silvibacterium dinghuense]|uniref:DUF3857 domain-containing protein n=1 Tax=Silvibacterium dinghuense TaxID=1560006 RepID=A0A4Q1SGZ5_9BACT|nr:DUF3857 and transglutaminase domain-containing protein [Silvibacterium dinghuense]RXS96796.1 DUF3857 domain-containing protein [Silvibacterium dinghuense]GGG93706.1 hypothetical protein GCM10011586_05600 [Silvibacterium dinghuense]
MPSIVRSFAALCLLSLPFVAHASDWQQPTPEELKMTSLAADPNAPAVYLFREETVQDDMHIHTMYARIKILNEKGKDMFSDIEIPYERRQYQITNIEGRTIHPDGTVIPFTGKPMDKLVVKTAEYKFMRKVFSLPDVQVGSILEYRWTVRYDDNSFSSPEWYIQQPVYVLKAHYHFRPTATTNTILHTDQFGHQEPTNGLLYIRVLPAGTDMQKQIDGYDLVMANIPAIPDEEYMPPMHSFSYRVIFYYSPWRTPEEFWKQEGKYWSKDVERFASPTAKLKEAVGQIVSPGDSEEVKAEKLYAAVMKLENTSFTRDRLSEEDKAAGLRVKNADDLWEQKRGTAIQLTRLYVAMCRAAGLKAYVMAVTDRNESIMMVNYLDWSQMEDEIAIVNIAGKDVFLDPGERYAEFGKLKWIHAWAGGIRQTDNGTAMANTPSLTYKDTETDRYAQLQLDATGNVSGMVRVTMTGVEALRWRQALLRRDEDDVKKELADEFDSELPPGVHVKVDHFVSEDDPTKMLLVQFNVSGAMGTSTGKHVLLPATFFSAGQKALLAASKRENPIDLRYPSTVHDEVHVTLPDGMKLESLPQAATIPFMPNADYTVKFALKGNTFAYGRLIRVGTILYKAEEYPQLREFFQKTAAVDQTQMVLTPGAAVTGTGTAPAAGAPAKTDGKSL